MSSLEVVPNPPEQLVEWLEPSLQDTAGRDPLGFNTITLDRVLPQLLPGILQLSERARYFSIYAWMLWQFAERRRPATGDALDEFIRRREYELCLAFKLCPNCDGDGAIGGLTAGPRVNSNEDPLPRGLSVKSPKGGFGLYYRSPLIELGAVAPAGTPLGAEAVPTPIEVLRREPRVLALAESFQAAIEGTTYYEQYERSSDVMPRAVMEQLATDACLCRLVDHPAERDAIRALIFEPASTHEEVVAACEARRRGFALFLSLVDEDPDVALSTGEFWRRLIGRFNAAPADDSAEGETVAAWAALAMKECIQEPICSIWTHFCRLGVERQGLDGVAPAELRELIHELADGTGLALDGAPLAFTADEPVDVAMARLVSAASAFDWETLRGWTADENTAASGLVALLILAERVPDPQGVHPFWGEIAARRSEHQDGLLGVVALLRHRIATNPTTGELFEWLVHRFLIAPHEVIAYSKLPKATFRFTWQETGYLQFFTPGGGGLGRFAPSDDRRAAMSTLSEDLGYWIYDEELDGGRLTEDGQAFVSEVFDAG